MPAAPTGLMCPSIGRLFRQSPTPPADPPVQEVALAIYHGGKVDGLPGMEAVAHVIQNRTADPVFGGDARSVIAAGTEQFVDIKQALPSPRSTAEKRLFGLARRMATQLVLPPRHLSFPDTTGGALYYDRRRPATQHSVNRPAGMAGTTPTQAAVATAAAQTGGGTAQARSASTEGDLSESDSPTINGGARFTPPLASSQPVQPSRGHRPLFFRDRQPSTSDQRPSQASSGSPDLRPPSQHHLSASSGAGSGSSQAVGSGSSGATSSSSAPSGDTATVARQQAHPSGLAPANHRSPPASAAAVTSSSSMPGTSTPPPAPPPPSQMPHFASLPSPALGSSVGTNAAAARLPATRPMLPRAGVTAAPMPPRRGGPESGEGYHDMVLPCGLFQDEVIELMYRDLSPEDFEMLSKLDERLPKKNIAQRNIVDRLPRFLGRDCEESECRVCLAEFEPISVVVKLPCRHAFHRACISKWLTQCKNTCPLCFTPIQGPQPATPTAPAAGGNTAAAAQSTLRTV